ncbi:MAG: hypothetical protein WCI92_10725 [Bacteroidota bacterium]
MEELKNQSSTNVLPELLQFTSESVVYLLKAAKWGKFLAILGFVVTGLCIVSGIGMIFVINRIPEDMLPLNMSFSPQIVIVFYILFAGIYTIPVFFLNSFSNNAIRAINLSDSAVLTTSIKNLKNLFVFVGVSTIVILSLYTIILIVVGIAAAVSL